MTKKVSIHFLPLPKPATSGDTRPPKASRVPLHRVCESARTDALFLCLCHEHACHPFTTVALNSFST